MQVLGDTLLSEQRHRLRQFDRSWRSVTLDNGLHLVHVPRPHDQRLYLGATIRVGSRYEDPNKLGVSHFLEHMMFRGSERYPSFRKLAEAFEWLGGEWNAGTGQEHTEYWYSGSRYVLDQALDLFFEFLHRPKLNDIDTERKIIFRELEGELNEFGLSTDLDYHSHRLIWPNSKLANPILGTKDSLQSITTEDLSAYRQEYYRPENMCIVVVGCDDDERIIDKLSHYFSQIPVRNTSNPAKLDKLKRFRGPKCSLIRHPDNEYFVQLSFRCHGEWHKEAVSYDLISRILTDGFCSRLANRIREQLGMVYDIDTEVSLFSDAGSIDIYAHVGLDKLTPFIQETGKILKLLKQKGPTKKELERAKRRSLSDIELLSADPDNLGFKLGWGVLNNKKPSLERGFDSISEFTSEKIREVCGQIFTAARCALVILGPERSGLVNEMQELLTSVLD